MKFPLSSLRLLPGLLALAGFLSPVRAAEFDLSTATIADINAAVDAGALSSEKLVQLYLNRIAAYDQAGPKLNTIITLNPNALAEARALDAERKATGRRSPLHGIPVIVKDLINTAGMQTTGGFVAMKGAVPQYDANVIKRLHAAGAIILAKTNLSDWLGKPRADGGSSIAGLVLNPYDLSRNFAGSSSGTGAGIASWFATVGLGSETGTSIRGPTTDGSLVGLAGTEGLVGRSGAMANSFTHERIGPIARNVYDLAVTLDAIVGIDANDLITAQALTKLPTVSYATFLNPDGLHGARIGVLRDMFRSGPQHAEGLALAEQAIFALRKAGADVYDPVSLGLNLERIRTIKVNYWEAETILDKYFVDYGPNAPFHSVKEMVRKFPDLVKPDFVTYANYAPGPDPEYQSRLKSRRVLREAVVALMDKFQLDAVVFPFKTVPAAKLAERRGRGADPDPLNKLALSGDEVSESDNYLSSMTGLPGLLVPMGYIANGVPLSLEFLGRPFSEPTLIKLASGFESQTHLRQSPPTVPALPGEKFTY
ncbi:MAG TPA: amidase family protein [Opitutaceae bacterium]|nr:amidase family protein [Opitutaceae bacterium]